MEVERVKVKKLVKNPEVGAFKNFGSRPNRFC